MGNLLVNIHSDCLNGTNLLLVWEECIINRDLLIVSMGWGVVSMGEMYC